MTHDGSDTKRPVFLLPKYGLQNWSPSFHLRSASHPVLMFLLTFSLFEFTKGMVLGGKYNTMALVLQMQ